MRTRLLWLPLGRLLNCKMDKCMETCSIHGIFVWLRKSLPPGRCRSVILGTHLSRGAPTKLVLLSCTSGPALQWAPGFWLLSNLTHTPFLTGSLSSGHAALFSVPWTSQALSCLRSLHMLFPLPGMLSSEDCKLVLSGLLLASSYIVWLANHFLNK